MATYKVKKGDTLSEIAADADISLSALLKLNPQIKNKNLINPGQVITTSKATAAKPKPVPAAMSSSIFNPYATTPGSSAGVGTQAVEGGPGSASEFATKATPITATAVVPVTPATATATATAIPRNIDKDVAEAIASGNQAVKDINETLSSLAAPGDNAPIKPVGTPAAYVYDPVSKTWVMPPKPTDGKNYVWDNNTGWTVSTILAGSTGLTTDAPTGPTLASNTFKNTLALFFGPNEISKPWVDVLYKSVSGFYKTGSTAEESFNMALQDVRNNPIMEPFTKRFKGIFALQDLKVKGVAVTVPTIAEYFASESKMGDVLRSSGLGDIANEDFLGDVLGKNVSVTEFSNRIVNIFDRIDSAPKEIKDTFSRFFPTVDRISLAKALALGDKGAKALEKEIAGYEVLSAAEQLNIGANKVLGGVDVERAANYAAKGYGYQKALTDFGKVARITPVEKKLAEISGVQSLGQVGVENAVLGQNLTAQQQLEVLAELEGARYSGKSGTIGSKSFASQNRGMLY